MAPYGPAAGTENLNAIIIAVVTYCVYRAQQLSGAQSCTSVTGT